MIKKVLDFSQQLLMESIQKGETVIDATCGNGKDTLFLSKIVGQDGKVLAFDIQEQAIQNSRQLLKEAQAANVSLIHDSHANMSHYLSEEYSGTIGGAIFNLGYLPKSDKSVITRGETTIAALTTLLEALKKDRLVVLIVYHGHLGGEAERDMLMSFTMNLDQQKFNVLRYGFLNQKNHPPFLIAIEKRVE